MRANKCFSIVKILFLYLFLFLHLLGRTDALNCKPFSPDEAKLAAELFHQIPLVGEAQNGTSSAIVEDESPISGSQSGSSKPKTQHSGAKLVAHFVKSLRQKFNNAQQPLSTHEAISDDERHTIEHNGRKMVTMATDLCNRLPTKGENLSPGYVHCVQFLLYHHMQKLVWRLQNKWQTNINDNHRSSSVGFGGDQSNDQQQQSDRRDGKLLSSKNYSLLEIYTDKKMRAWETMVTIYGKELADLTEIDEKIRRKFEFCLIIEGETKLKCSPISVENAELFVNTFHRIAFEPEYEQRRSKKAELIGMHIFNALRSAAIVRQRRRGKGREKASGGAVPKTDDDEDDDENSDDDDDDDGNDNAAAAKAWKQAEPSMRVRVHVLVNTAERQCRKLTKNPFKPFKKLGRSLSKLGRSLSSMTSSEQRKKQKQEDKEAEEEEAEKDGVAAASGEKLSSEFVNCIFHYMYTFSLALLGQIEAINGEKLMEEDKHQQHQRLRAIYEPLRAKARKRMEMTFYFGGLKRMDKWLYGEQQQQQQVSSLSPSSSPPADVCASAIEEREEEESEGDKGGGGGGEDEEDEEETDDNDDPFKGCAIVDTNDDQPTVEEDVTGNGKLMDKSFDEHLFQCASQYFEAVAEDKFVYKLFVNLHTMQLDTEMEFPPLLNDRMQTNGRNGQNAMDRCLMIRELLMSLNKNLAHRLNFEKITSQTEKEQWTKLHRTYENLRLEKLDNKWLHRMGTKMSQSYENFVRDFRKWRAHGMLTHPIRDKYRQAREGIVATLRRTLSRRRRRRRKKRMLTPAGTSGRGGEKKLMRGQRKPKNEEQQLFKKKEQQQSKNAVVTAAGNIEPTRRSIDGDKIGRKSSSSSTLGELFAEENKIGRKSSSTLRELFAEENFEAPEIVMTKIDRKMEEIRQKIAENSLGKRLNGYTVFFRAFYITLALELAERMDNQHMTNWHFVLRAGAAVDDKQKIEREKNRKNVELIKREIKIFDDIVKRMGKTMPKTSPNKWKFWKTNKKATTTTAQKESSPLSPKATAQNWCNASGDTDELEEEEEEAEEEKSKRVGFELRFLGYTTETSGAQLLESLQDEMQLNMDQFNMSFDGQCDLTNDLNDCFVASDGIDFDAQLENGSLFGKDVGQMGALERAAESLFKKLNRWSYKFGQKSKRHRNMLKRFFNNKIKAILDVIPQMMTDQVSPFELVIPFYLPMKKGVKFIHKKVLVKPSKWFYGWALHLFSTVNLFINTEHNDDKVKEAKAKKGKEKIDERIELSEVDPSINVPNVDQALNDSLDPIIKQMSKMAEKLEEKNANSKKKNSPKNVLIKFKRIAKMLKDVFINFGLKKAQAGNEQSDDAHGQNKRAATPSKNTRNKRRRRRAIETGAGINAYIAAGEQGSSTVGALLIDAKVVDWSLTTPLPGLHLHWLHFNHGIMLGKYNIAMSLTTGIIVIFIIVGMLYWWHAIKLAVYLSMQYGDPVGWVIIFVAAILYLIFCVGFVMV